MKKKMLSAANIGRFIREKRLELNYTQDDLANELGITKTAVSNWENGNSLVDVKYLVPLSNIFCVTIDDILFSNQNNELKLEYSDWIRQFKEMTSYKMTDKNYCIKLLEIFIEEKNRMVELVKKYIDSRDSKIIKKIECTNKLGLGVSEDWNLNKEGIEKLIKRQENVEDMITTPWAPILCGEYNDNSDGMYAKKIKRIFMDTWIFDYEHDAWFGAGLSNNYALINFILFIGCERIFRNYIKTFSNEYRNEMLFNLIRKNKIINPQGDFDKQTLKAIKWMLKADSEYWVNGENRTEELMKKIL